MRKGFIVTILGIAAFGLPAFGASQKELERGRYLVSIMDCGTCHTDGAFLGKPDLAHPLGGSSIGHQVPGLGTFWPPNLTPDKEAGLGTWSEKEIVAAVRKGVRPDGRELAPAMPWRAYANLSDADAFALAAYLKSVAPLPGGRRQPLSDGAAAPTPVMRIVMPAEPGK